ncbi:hypothetical protein PCH_Pc21g13630 [Penicillium rubens Wisconsin 54-1255]|uniref:Uncharacterized protein n=1 Tax=Penicillium rubens (strain ATCC 28089 / DSM 1075 / NRRL 1951 / Wisconsin 54-1255) TaxID=500485 RepID=B6HNB3_PENRW|nr:hypothetical protein PCH_Pc21g13630 [Penicillium rubens Wisconsin 54-1255]
MVRVCERHLRTALDGSRLFHLAHIGFGMCQSVVQACIFDMQPNNIAIPSTSGLRETIIRIPEETFLAQVYRESNMDGETGRSPCSQTSRGVWGRAKLKNYVHDSAPLESNSVCGAAVLKCRGRGAVEECPGGDIQKDIYKDISEDV